MMKVSLSDKVYSFTDQNALFYAPCHVLVGVSGGADSVSLLHCLCHWPEEGLQVTAMHIHHGLRGEGADRDEDFVSKLCAELGVPLLSAHVDVKQVAEHCGIGLEEAGRRERYRLFKDTCQEIGADYILTAHTASDQAETVLMHLIRGCGTDGLTGIPAKRGSIRRPLLSCTRQEVEMYCRQHDLLYVTDETNADTRYTRNRIRHEVLPLFREINPSATQALCRLATHCGEDSRYLGGLAEKALDVSAAADGSYALAAFSSQSAPILRRMLYQVLTRSGVPQISESHILAAEQAVRQGSGTVRLPGCLSLCVTAGSVYVIPTEMGSVPAELPVEYLPFTGTFGDEPIALEVISVNNSAEWENVHKMFFKFSLDYDRIQGGLSVRTRLPGEVLCPAGRGVHKPLKKLLNEWRVPVHRRDFLPLLCDSEGVVLVPGCTCAERVRATASTKHFLVWKATSEQG